MAKKDNLMDSDNLSESNKESSKRTKVKKTKRTKELKLKKATVVGQQKEVEQTPDKDQSQTQAKLAKLFNIDLTKPKQSQRINFLFNQYQDHLNKSQLECFLYDTIRSNAAELAAIYATQRSEITKLEQKNENKQFFATRVAYLVNKYRVKIEEHKREIKQAQDLLEIYKKDGSDTPYASFDEKDLVENLEIQALEHYQKAFEVNKQLRNNIIGYENRLCLYKLNQLYLNYRLYVNQEILTYEEQQKLHNAKINREFDEVISHFSLPHKKLVAFKKFLSSKIVSQIEDLEKLKEPFKVMYDRDVQQIDRMIQEMENRQSRDLHAMVEVINHYQKIVVEQESRSKNHAKYLVALVEKLFTERINQAYELVSSYDQAAKRARSLTDWEVKLLLDLNRRELQAKIEKLKHDFTNSIKPLSDDFDKMVYLVDRDHALDMKAYHDKMVELRSLENENLNFFSNQFEKDKQELETMFNDSYQLIMDDCSFAKDQFDQLFAKSKKQVQNICTKIIARNDRFWLKTKNEFVLEAKKFLTKLHYESAPWTHRWKGTPRAWMHDYLLTNLSAEYLQKVGESVKKISPQGQLFINVAKAMVQFNENARELYKKRDEVEYQQLIRLNSIHDIDLTNLKNLCNQNLSLVNSEFSYLEKKIKSLDLKN